MLRTGEGNVQKDKRSVLGSERVRAQNTESPLAD